MNNGEPPCACPADKGYKYIDADSNGHNGSQITDCYLNVGPGQYRDMAATDGKFVKDCPNGTYRYGTALPGDPLAIHEGDVKAYYNTPIPIPDIAELKAYGGVNSVDSCVPCTIWGKFDQTDDTEYQNLGNQQNTDPPHRSYSERQCYFWVDPGEYRFSKDGDATKKCPVGSYKESHRGFLNVGLDRCDPCPGREWKNLSDINDSQMVDSEKMVVEYGSTITTASTGTGSSKECYRQCPNPTGTIPHGKNAWVPALSCTGGTCGKSYWSGSAYRACETTVECDPGYVRYAGRKLDPVQGIEVEDPDNPVCNDCSPGSFCEGTPGGCDPTVADCSGQVECPKQVIGSDTLNGQSDKGSTAITQCYQKCNETLPGDVRNGSTVAMGTTEGGNDSRVEKDEGGNVLKKYWIYYYTGKTGADFIDGYPKPDTVCRYTVSCNEGFWPTNQYSTNPSCDSCKPGNYCPAGWPGCAEDDKDAEGNCPIDGPGCPSGKCNQPVCPPIEFLSCPPEGPPVCEGRRQVVRDENNYPIGCAYPRVTCPTEAEAEEKHGRGLIREDNGKCELNECFDGYHLVLVGSLNRCDKDERPIRIPGDHGTCFEWWNKETKEWVTDPCILNDCDPGYKPNAADYKDATACEICPNNNGNVKDWVKFDIEDPDTYCKIRDDLPGCGGCADCKQPKNNACPLDRVPCEIENGHGYKDENGDCTEDISCLTTFKWNSATKKCEKQGGSEDCTSSIPNATLAIFVTINGVKVCEPQRCKECYRLGNRACTRVSGTCPPEEICVPPTDSSNKPILGAVGIKDGDKCLPDGCDDPKQWVGDTCKLPESESCDITVKMGGFTFTVGTGIWTGSGSQKKCLLKDCNYPFKPSGNTCELVPGVELCPIPPAVIITIKKDELECPEGTEVICPLESDGRQCQHVVDGVCQKVGDSCPVPICHINDYTVGYIGDDEECHFDHCVWPYEINGNEDGCEEPKGGVCDLEPEEAKGSKKKACRGKPDGQGGCDAAIGLEVDGVKYRPNGKKCVREPGQECEIVGGTCRTDENGDCTCNNDTITCTPPTYKKSKDGTKCEVVGDDEPDDGPCDELEHCEGVSVNGQCIVQTGHTCYEPSPDNKTCVPKPGCGGDVICDKKEGGETICSGVWKGEPKRCWMTEGTDKEEGGVGAAGKCYVPNGYSCDELTGPDDCPKRDCDPDTIEHGKGVMRNGECVPDWCDDNYYPVDGKCVPMPPQDCTCPAGVNGVCKWIDGACRPIKCNNSCEVPDGVKCVPADCPAVTCPPPGTRPEHAVSSIKKGDECWPTRCVPEDLYYPAGGICKDIPGFEECDVIDKKTFAKTGIGVWDGKECKPKKCNDGLIIYLNQCVPWDTPSTKAEECKLADPEGAIKTAVREWIGSATGGTWGECKVTECMPGFTNDPTLRNDWGKPCSRCRNYFGYDDKAAVESYAKGCEIRTCVNEWEQYIRNSDGSQCIPICLPRSDETGTMTWNPSSRKCDRVCTQGGPWKMWEQ